MKIVNEKGKLFGIVNLIDLLMLAAVALVVVAAISLTSGSSDSNDNMSNQYQEMTFTVRLRGLSLNTIGQMTSLLSVPEQLVADQSTVPNFYLAEYRIEDAFLTSTDSEGSLVTPIDPLRKDLLVTIKGLTLTTNSPVYKVATQEVRVGRAYFVKTSLFEMSGTIETLDIGEPVTMDTLDPEDPASWNWKPAA